MTTPTSDPRFIYADLTPPVISQEMIDQMAKAILDPEATKLGWLGVGVILAKVGFCTAYVIIWKEMAAAKLLIAKQKYEAGLGAAAQAELDADVMPQPKK